MMQVEPFRFSPLQSRAVTQENPTGGKGLGGKGRGNGNCRKGAPAFNNVKPGEIKELCNIEGPGMVRHLWMTVHERSPEALRSYVLRIYWDDAPYPSVEAPFGDFFGVAHGRTADFMTPWLGTPEGRGFQCYFPMPFSKRCRITFENDSPWEMPWLFYQVDYTLGDTVTDDMGRFHAHFRRQNPCPVLTDYTLLDTKGTPGVYLGAVVGVDPRGPGWWGEGEFKFYIDGDTQYPTINGTGFEDYFCSGWGLKEHAALYTGVNHLEKQADTGQDRLVSAYRFHVLDPVYFQSSLKVQVQQLGAAGTLGEGWDTGVFDRLKKQYGWVGTYVHPGMSNWIYDRSDDYCSVAYWYQRLTGEAQEPIPPRGERIAGLTI